MTTETETLNPPSEPQPGALLRLGGAVAIFLVVFGLGSAVGGEVGQFMGTSLNALPFAVLAVLAYLGGRRPNWAWIASGLWLALLVGGTALIALAFTLITQVDLGAVQAGATPELAAGAGPRMLVLMLGMIGSLAIGGLTLIPAMRRQLARWIPIDPDSFVHTMALAAVVTITLLCALPLLVVGRPPLLDLVEQVSGSMADGLGRDSAGMLRDQLYGLVWTIPAAALAVGLGVRRNLGETIQRLGLVRPSWRQALAGVGVALLLVGFINLLGLGIDWLWGLLGWPVTDEEAFAELLSFAINPIGALVIGITAGLGEELAVRGVLQPRLGLLLSNLFFTSLHALQYNWDALLVVFIVGVVCGVVRQRTNTSTAAIVHGVYNFTLIMLAFAFS